MTTESSCASAVSRPPHQLPLPLRLLIPFIIFAVNATPQHASAQGPGFPNSTFNKGELLSGSTPVGANGGRAAAIAYHQGYLMINFESPGSAPGSDGKNRYIDISNPRAPVERIMGGNANNTFDAHGYLQEGTSIFGFKGVGGFTFQGTAPVTPSPDTSLFFPSTGAWLGRGLLFQPFQMSSYWTYGTEFPPARLFKRTQKLAEWDHVGETGVKGHPVALIGTRLVYASDQSDTGIAQYDITSSLRVPGTKPTLTGLYNKIERFNGIDVKSGAYWPEVWGSNGQLFLFDADRFHGLHVYNITDPRNMKLVWHMENLQSGTWWKNPDPMYVQFQDNYAFTDRWKIDMNKAAVGDLTAAEEIIDSIGNRMSVNNFSLPLGNMLVTGGMDGFGELRQGAAIWAHQAAPDTKGPSVGYHIPAVNQTNYPLQAPLTFLIHETLRSETIVNGDTVTVRPVLSNRSLGAAVAAQVVFTFNDQLQLTPNTDLQPDTTYEVELRGGGIKDAAGNGIVGHKFRFSTGATVIDPGVGISPTATATAASTPTQPSATATPRATATASVQPNTIRIDVGSKISTVDSQGKAWEADRGFSGGGLNNWPELGVPNVDLNGQALPALYGTERWGVTSGQIPISNGSYTVQLYFIEHYNSVPAEGRVFDIDVEGQKILNLNVKAQVGMHTTLVKTVSATVQDGNLTLAFTPRNPNFLYPMLSAIEIQPSGPPNAPPTSTPTVMATATATKAPVIATATTVATATSTAVATPTSVRTATPTPTKEATVTPTPFATPTWSDLRIDSGAVVNSTDSLGNIWLADKWFKGGEHLDWNKPLANEQTTTAAVMYRTERYDLTGYRIPVPAGLYTVKLHFVEHYDQITAPQQRVFGVQLEGQNLSVDGKIDVFKEASGRAKVLVKSADITVNDGTLDIDFLVLEWSPMLSGIEVIKKSVSTDDLLLEVQKLLLQLLEMLQALIVGDTVQVRVGALSVIQEVQSKVRSSDLSAHKKSLLRKEFKLAKADIRQLLKSRNKATQRQSAAKALKRAFKAVRLAERMLRGEKRRVPLAFGKN